MHGYSIHCCPSKLREFIKACFVERRFCRVFVPFIRAVAIFLWGFQQVPIGSCVQGAKAHGPAHSPVNSVIQGMERFSTIKINDESLVDAANSCRLNVWSKRCYSKQRRDQVVTQTSNHTKTVLAFYWIADNGVFELPISFTDLAIAGWSIFGAKSSLWIEADRHFDFQLVLLDWLVDR